MAKGLYNPIYRFRHNKVVKALEEDPNVQLKFHLFFSYLWLLNMVSATIVFFAFPHFWSKYSLFYILFVSLYANFATDYDAVSASMAAREAMRAKVAVLEDNEQVESGK